MLDAKLGRPKNPPPYIDFPTTVNELINFLCTLVSQREVFEKRSQRMERLTPNQTVVLISMGLRNLQQMLLRNERQKDAYMTKRFGTVFRTLDFDAPTEGEIIIAQYNGSAVQCIVRTGTVFRWNSGIVGEKFCALNQVEKWRPCILTDKPVHTSSVKNDVLSALERGAAVQRGEKV